MFGVVWEVGDPLSTPCPAEGVFPGRYLPADPRLVGAGPGRQQLAGGAGRAAAPCQPAAGRHDARWVQCQGADPRPAGTGGVCVSRGAKLSGPTVMRCCSPSERGPQGGSGAEVCPGVRVPGGEV